MPLCLGAQCRQPWSTGSSPGKPAAQTQSDRLKATYPDLDAGRFWVLADFEHLKHTELFRVVSHSGDANCISSLKGGVPQTGRRCMRVTLADPLDMLVITNAEARQWLLKRDWRDFYLLLAAVHCPVESTALELSIVTGPPEGGATAHSRVPLARGWNNLRLDLVEAAERVALDDVRELRLSLPQADRPIELVLDDIILVDNRRDVFGSSDDAAQGLYIQEQGRRWNVGAAGRFELGFANGQIVHWFDLAADPHRLDNLVGGDALGPSPVVLPEAGTGGLSASLLEAPRPAEIVVTRQQILEANPLRIVVACAWQFTRPGAPPASDDSFHRWTYSILRDGSVYVHVESTAETPEWKPRALGLLTGRTQDGTVQAFAHRAGQPSDPEDLRRVTYACAAPTSADKSGLLWVLPVLTEPSRIDVLPHPQERRIDLLASGGIAAGPVARWTGLLQVWPPGSCVPAVARARALDYCYPAPLNMLVGEVIADTPGDADGDGFNEQLGCHVLQPEADLLRFEIDGRKRPRFGPLFQVVNTAGQQAWVYVDHLILETVARDSAGNLLFQIPETVRHTALVEVVLRNPQAPPAS